MTDAWIADEQAAQDAAAAEIASRRWDDGHAGLALLARHLRRALALRRTIADPAGMEEIGRGIHGLRCTIADVRRMRDRLRLTRVYRRLRAQVRDGRGRFSALGDMDYDAAAAVYTAHGHRAARVLAQRRSA